MTKKVFFFLAGTSPTVSEAAEIAALNIAAQAPFALTVVRGNMTGAKDYNYGNGPAPCDAVLGTIPDNVPIVQLFASKAGTFSGVGTAADTITIDGVVYTLRAAPTTVANEVKIGVDAATTAANLVAAINKAAGGGTLYGSLTVIHPTVRATALGAVVTLTAKVAGVGGNSIAISESGTGFSFAGGATALSGGGPSGFYEEKPSFFTSGAWVDTITLTTVNGVVTASVAS